MSNETWFNIVVLIRTILLNVTGIVFIAVGIKILMLLICGIILWIISIASLFAMQRDINETMVHDVKFGGEK